MAGITLRTARQVVPMIYAYTTPEIARHNGWTKIGYTEQSVDKRLKQQTHTADVLYHEEWRGNAVYDDGSGEVFTDHDFHAYLRKLNVENDRKNEWFHLDGQQSRRYFQDFRMNRGRVQLDAAIAYTLREEQARAVHDTKTYYQSHPGGEYLWNAKPRFGKTLSVYDFCKQVDAQTVLIVTNRPAIANSWYSDYVRFLGRESGYLFVSHVDALAGQPHVLDEQGYLDAAAQGEKLYKRIEFVSLQDMKGSKYFGGEYDKLRHLTELNWDVLVIDEAHEGVDTYKTDLAFDRIRRKFTLHLSGTPFKALANDKFAGDAIFNWTYADEQAAKRNWQGAPGQQNPYANLPMLNLYTYQMSEIIRDEIQQGVEIDGETQEFAFDLNEFFKVKPSGSFEHEAEVDRFLDAMTTQNKFPFSTPELRAELKHTFWLLNRVDSARALAKKLQAHPVFRDYEVILAAGDGKLDDTDENQKSFDRVKAAIAHHEKTITLSVGQLTTGVTIPEWSAVLIFDYIPPQKTNQIFTPKWVVKKMVDLLEQENPGCFDDPGKTFLDPYMKSGLYITEIVKRLYRSEKMRQAFPDDNARLEHIFAKQVYGLAPTEIIYRIAISYILGFAKDHGITAHHIRQADTLEFAKAGTMERELDKIFRD